MILNDMQLEWYGALIYQYYFNLNKYNIIKFESPDFILWQVNNCEGKIGLEFARPSTTTQNVGSKLSNKYFSRGLDHKQIQNMLTKSESRFQEHGEIGEINGVKYISYSQGLVNTSCHHKLICKTILEKTNKLNDNYTLFNKNVLFLLPFSSFLNNEEDIKVIEENLDLLISENLRVFDQVVIHTLDRMIVYENLSGKYSHKCINLDIDIVSIKQEEASEISK